jgi:hypothetical protein
VTTLRRVRSDGRVAQIAAEGTQPRKRSRALLFGIRPSVDVVAYSQHRVGRNPSIKVLLPATKMPPEEYIISTYPGEFRVSLQGTTGQ